MEQIEFGKGVELYKRYMLCTKSNNWLKMHGYPMRRRKSLR